MTHAAAYHILFSHTAPTGRVAAVGNCARLAGAAARVLCSLSPPHNEKKEK